MPKKFKALSLVCFILPVFTVISSYILSIKFNLVVSCIPNFEGCTSISRVGRYEPVKYFFKPLMYLFCIFLFFYWIQLFKILKKYKIKSKHTYYMAIFSVIFLSLYITFLGENNFYSFFKKVGIYLYIISVILSQHFESRLLFKNSNLLKKNFYIKILKIKYYFSSLIIFSGLILLPILLMNIENYPGIKNIISWNYFLLIQLYFFLVFLSIKVSQTIQPPPKTFSP